MAADTLDQLPGWGASLLDAEPVGHLGLLDSTGHPRVLPVTYAVCDGAAWTVVDNKPKDSESELARLRWLRERPYATLTVDHYEDDWTALAWVQLICDVAILEASASPAALAALARRYPQYRAEEPPGPLVRLSATRAVCWRASQK